MIDRKIQLFIRNNYTGGDIGTHDWSFDYNEKIVNAKDSAFTDIKAKPWNPIFNQVMDT